MVQSNDLCKFSDGGKLNWEDDLDLILLGYRSSIQSSMLYSLFELVYGMKARLPIKLDLPIHTYQRDEGIEALYGKGGAKLKNSA